jgi:hypothetical protein
MARCCRAARTTLAPRIFAPSQALRVSEPRGTVQQVFSNDGDFF